MVDGCGWWMVDGGWFSMRDGAGDGYWLRWMIDEWLLMADG
jgi:hypothetical protein